MKNVAPMMLLCAGIVLASLYGARNGPTYSHFRAQTTNGVKLPPPEPQERLVDWFQSAGLGWGAGVALIVVGAGVARRQMAADAAAGTSTGGMVRFDVEVQKVLTEVDELIALIAELAMDTDSEHARDRIDSLNFEVLNPIVEARAVFVARHGLGKFTDYFSPFSAGERQLARAWSAITDGHAVEARASLDSAHASFTHALEAWKSAEKP